MRMKLLLGALLAISGCDTEADADQDAGQGGAGGQATGGEVTGGQSTGGQVTGGSVGGAGGAAGGSTGGAGGSTGGAAGGAGGAAGGAGGAAGGASGGAGGASGGDGGEGGASGGTGGSAGGSGGFGGSIVPEGPCSEFVAEDTCNSEAECEWLAPGCGEPALPNMGCYPRAPCGADADCDEGLTCQEVTINPCFNAFCDACGAQRLVCLPRPAADCAGAQLDVSGRCVGPDGAAVDAACCAPYDCDPVHVACDALPPACPQGQVASVAGLCWGPCVDAGLCAEGGDAALCGATGGRWDEGSCGHYRCGQQPNCQALIPGCDCGAGQTFVQGQGCQPDANCGGAGEGELCDVANPACALGLICLERFGEGQGVCSEPGCLSDDECAPGEGCCYPCGIEGCVNQCIPVDDDGQCPLFP